MADALDSVTLEIWWSRLVGIADEAAAALLRTAFSTIVRESKDFATVLMDRRGQSVAESTGGIPAFAGLIPRTTRAFLERFPLETWREGDCVITNDPWLGIGHLPDIVVLTPIVLQGTVVGFAGRAAQSPDIGGSPSADSREVFEEGDLNPADPPLPGAAAERRDARPGPGQCPPAGAGARRPRGAGHRERGSRRRALDVLADAGLAPFDALAEAIHERSDRAMRRAISAIPDGRYESVVEVDGATTTRRGSRAR